MPVCELPYRKILNNQLQPIKNIIKNAQCKKCLKKFNEKDIYTIQQFQYRKEPTYEWTKKFFELLEIGEWDSFCEECIRYYSKVSYDAWKNMHKIKFQTLYSRKNISKL